MLHVSLAGSSHVESDRLVLDLDDSLHFETFGDDHLHEVVLPGGYCRHASSLCLGFYVLEGCLVLRRLVDHFEGVCFLSGSVC